MLFDTHVHLNDPYYKDKIENVIKNAEDSQVSNMLVVGYCEKTNAKAIEIANKYENIYAAVGYHPNHVNELSSSSYELLEKQLMEHKVVALGEIGLDLYWDTVSLQDQERAFKKQIDMANAADLPIIIHSREAMDKTYQILANNPCKGVMHCFSGSLEMANQFINLGIYISLAGPVTFKNAKQLKKVAQEINIDYLMIETDCPYLTPEPYRGQKNEPAYVSFIAKEIASLRGIDYNQICLKTSENAKRLFKIY